VVNGTTEQMPMSCAGALDTDQDCLYGIHLPTTNGYGSAQILINALGGMTMTITLTGFTLTDTDVNDGTTNFR